MSHLSNHTEGETDMIERDPNLEPVPPCDILRMDVLPAIDLPLGEVAQRLGVSRQTLSDILHGRRAITPRMALRIGKFVGNGPELWLRLQLDHDLWAARQEMGAELEQVTAFA